MTARVVIIIAFFLSVATVVYFATQKPGTADSAATVDKPTAASGTVVEVTMLYGTEKQPWVEAAAAQFQKDNPGVKITLQGKGSLDAAQAILDEKSKPTVFSPADSMVLNLLASDWQTKNHAELFATSGDDVPQPLVITPLVFVVWEDRANVLLKAAGGAITFKAIQKAVSSNQGWPAIGGSPDWGFVKLGHTDPTRSNSGLMALFLMTLEFYGKRGDIQVGDLLKPDYQKFVADIEKGVTKFETSTGTFMTDMVRFGPSKYDLAMVYESLAISQLENAQGRWGSLKVYYPATTLWSDHPIGLLQAEWVTEPQKTAARLWIAYLRSRAVQEKALAFGFRPADPSVPIKTATGENPFARLAQYGIKLDLPPVAKPPDGNVVRSLMTMWTRVAAPH